MLGHGNKSTEQAALTSWRRQKEGLVRPQKRDRPSEGHSRPEDGRGDLSGPGKKSTERALTLWRQQRERLVRTRKEIDRARGTHSLETAEGGTCQDTERNRLSKGHSQTGDGRRRDLSRHGKNPTEQEALTNWRRQREGLVGTQEETNRTRGTHSLETTEGGTCQDIERSSPSEGHSLPGDDRGRDLSGHRKTLTERGALTPWER